MLDARAVQASWYSAAQPAWWLRALAALYGLISGLRRWLYAHGVLPRVRLPVPVIVVGNITAGGAGKTPLVIALVEALRARGRKPAVISRGYSGSGKQARIVDSNSRAADVGDEACLIFQATQAPIAVGRDRPAAGQLMLNATAVDVLIADDGLQHYRLHRDLEICVIDGARRFGNRRLLPAGPLREPLARLDRVALRVCNGGDAKDGEVPMRLHGDEAVNLADANQRRPLREFFGQRVHAVAGIGNPERFFAQLRGAGLNVVAHAFPDHHAFVAGDFDFDDSAPLLMTAKDAVKGATFARAHWWSVPVRADLPQTFFDDVVARLRTK